MVVMVENRSHDHWVEVTCDCRRSANVVSTRGELCTVDTVPPGHRQVVNVLTRLDGSKGFSIHHTLTQRLFPPSGLVGLWSGPGIGREDHNPQLGGKVDGLHSSRPL